MGEISKIEWTDATWNPWHGCIKVSPGCKNCYMYRDKKRYGQDPYTVVRSKAPTFSAPLKWKDPRMVFTCSWSDFFIEEADEWRAYAWEVIRQTPHHTYQILTKRPERILDNLPHDWPLKNVWLGVSIESQEQIKRAETLKQVLCYKRFLSLEPLLDRVDLCETFGMWWNSTMQCFESVGHAINGSRSIDWVIVGGESGPGFRQINPDWARSIRDQCKAAGVPFFMKQMSGTKPNMQVIPPDLMIREMPR